MSAFLYAGNAYSADVTLAWDGVSQSGVTVTGYRVYYRADGSSGLTKGCEVASTNCTVSDLADGETYHFVATAYNSYGESEPSDPVSYTVPDVLQTFTITSSADGYGSISPSGTVSLTEGESKTFAISPTQRFSYSGRFGGRDGHRSFFSIYVQRPFSQPHYSCDFCFKPCNPAHY